MKTKFLIVFTVLFASLTAFAADKAIEVLTLDHQMSEACEKKIKDNLRFEKGISKIDVSLKANTITVTYDPKKTDSEKIIEGFKRIGFTAFPVKSLESNKKLSNPAHCSGTAAKAVQGKSCSESKATPCNNCSNSKATPCKEPCDHSKHKKSKD